MSTSLEDLLATFNGQAPAWAPETDDVAALLQSRTDVDLGAGDGSFSEDTTPTETLVARLIAFAANELEDILGTDLPNSYADDGGRLAALRAAQLIATSLDDDSADPSSQQRIYGAMWLQGSQRLAARLQPAIDLPVRDYDYQPPSS